MWNSWFSNGLFTKRSGKNPNLQKRIGNLFGSSVKSSEKDASPTLRTLQSQRNKVKRMSSVYEENISLYNEHNSSILSCKSSTKVLSMKIDEILKCRSSSLAVDTKPADWNNVKMLLKNIQSMDDDYINHMKLLIEKYVDALDDIPALRMKDRQSITNRQKEELFGPIKQIHELHNNEFHPILLACSGDVEFFAKYVSQMCITGSFGVYISYAMDEKECEHRRNVYYKHFMNEIMDKVGFAFELRAIQQLARYHLVIIEMLKQLKELEAPEETIEALKKTEADWKHMMDKVYEMRRLASN